MKSMILILIFLLWISSVWADNKLTWTNNTQIPTAEVAIEAMGVNGWEEIARVAPGVTTYTHVGVDEGFYRVRAVVPNPNSADVFSAYSNSAIKAAAPTMLNVQ